MVYGGFKLNRSLAEARLSYVSKTPNIFDTFLQLQPQVLESLSVRSDIAPLFPHLQNTQLIGFQAGNHSLNQALNVGIVFSGGPAAGGHNIAAGVFDALQKINPSSKLIGFLGGPAGIISNRWQLIDQKKIDAVRNQGGFDLLGSGRTKIEKDEQLLACCQTCEIHKLDGLIIVGGDDSNTNAAVLAEYFLSNGCSTAVVGVPKTIDGDLKNNWIETSFGFDSASKTYSEIIGNVMRDAASQNKYYFFIKVMGRTASHLVLECALQTRPNLALIGEEVKAKGMTLASITGDLADLVEMRAREGKFSGVILIPEGIIEFIPEFKQMIQELKGQKDAAHLTQGSSNLFHSLPVNIQKQLFLNPDPHGNIQVSKIETERLFIDLVHEELQKRGFDVNQFQPQPLFTGYEGRCCLPSNFDSSYCYSLGMTAVLLIAYKHTGMMAIVKNLKAPPEEWVVQGVSLVAMLELALKNGKEKPVIRQNLLDLSSPLFQKYAARRTSDRLFDSYQNPGPIQFYGPKEFADRITETLKESQV